MEGTHGQMLAKPWVDRLAAYMRSWLDEVNG
jgi:hypothetical protein